ncbi:MAG TPA: 2-dehydropantoate 2-reductase [Candidatus Binataceae bacterium]|nr:2-dehydropantoate 2-reductase [Candidatus Binataceae bacterium]
MAKIAVIGPGAIGCVVAAGLIESGRHQVTVCARSAFERIVVRFPDGKTLEVAAAVIPDAAIAPRADWVILCTKAYQTASAAGWFRALVGNGTQVAVLQNGVEHEARVISLVPNGTPIVPVVVRMPAQRVAPGNVSLDGRASLGVPEGPSGLAFAALFAGTRVSATTTADFVTEVWTKLCLNAANGAIMALTEHTIAVLRQPPIADLARTIIRECIAVGRAEGAKLDDTMTDRLIDMMIAIPHAETHGNSMYYDRMAGREMEYDARNGVIARLGARHGIPTPINSALTALLSAVRPHRPREDC